MSRFGSAAKSPIELAQGITAKIGERIILQKENGPSALQRTLEPFTHPPNKKGAVTLGPFARQMKIASG
ncbi:hypothetical protein [Bradyrhizobium elkanii]|uniref:hypothetical protein n=1 Tax=Bradyrhizobium elkanii TaxID=29448 RepID=UPI0012FD9178|nr:hypothetical protein [Bradyrhizobium elkanii]WLA80957.1 hypothetical protein QNJ99_37135 [Bradyrhizobium elkanii]